RGVGEGVGEGLETHEGEGEAARRGVGQAQEKGEDEGQGHEQKDVGEGGGEEQLAQSSIAWRQGIRGGEERCGASRLCSFHESQTQADRWTRLRSRIRLSA